MSFQTRGIGRGAQQQRTPAQRSPITVKHIAYLMRTNPNIKTESDAKLFLTRLQRERPKESIHVTKEGRIFSVSQDGMITDIDKDGRAIRSFSRTSYLAKDILAHYEITPDGVVRPRETEATADEIYRLISTNPKIKTEAEAELFLSELRRYRPKESIHVTEEGAIYSEAENGTVSKLGADGKATEVYPATSEAAKKARALFPHYDETGTKERRRIP
ncbi:MAG: hypothetical protein QW390_02430 [Candidatus Bathyarchaeia archaeon]